MRVYRLEFKHQPTNGPFNPPENPWPFKPTIAPADAAQVVAKVEGVKGPFEMPGIDRDMGSKSRQIRTFMANHNSDWSGDFVFGFSSLEQYREWFPTSKVRKALFVNPMAKVDTIQAKVKFNDLELRAFDIPDKDVLVAPHQVLFPVSRLSGGRAIPREQAIA